MGSTPGHVRRPGSSGKGRIGNRFRPGSRSPRGTGVARGHRALVVAALAVLTLLTLGCTVPPDTGPVITKLDPLHGPVAGGTTVTVTGVRLTGATAVSFGGTAATFTPDSDTQVTATSPASATAGPVEVTVTTATGTSVPMTWVYDSPPAQDRPSAGFDVEPVAWCWGLQAGCHPENGESVTFTSTSTDSDGTIVSEEWDFDGNLDFADASGTPVSHVFDTPGSYAVRLRVTDDDGATDTASRTVIVTDADADDDGTPNRQDCDPYDASRHPGAPDAPDLNSVDNDCDGIDGRVSQAVFVATPDDGGVDDPQRGVRREEPLATISYALMRAQSTGRQHVYVAGGTYQEALALNLVPGISIYGGYRPTGGHCLTFYCEYWERPGALTTIVNRTGTGGGVVTVNAANIPTTAPVTLQSLDIVSGSATVAGTSSIAVRATSSPGLTLEAVTVEAGNGAPGANGTSGSSGGDGTQGASPSPGVCPTTGATGGAGGAALGVSGGNGGNGAPQPGSGNPGVPGSAGSTGSIVVGGGTPGGGGAGGAANAPGGNGANGGNGGTGTSGAAGTGGTISAGSWSSNPGGGGTNGQPGGGGGGGGGAGSVSPVGFDGYPGDGGGGGGAGGAAGTAASGGQGGGASFGILVIGASPTSPGPNIVWGYQRGSAIRSGDGGAGGIGAIGGRGGLGGAGGAGGTTCGPLKGGDGGRGGRGGDGGHGGGGAGGPSYAVYRYNSLVTIEPSYTRLFHGSGGTGGPSLGNAGTSGTSGTTN